MIQKIRCEAPHCPRKGRPLDINDALDVGDTDAGESVYYCRRCFNKAAAEHGNQGGDPK